MRLDRFFSETGTLSRRECAAFAKRGQVTVNGVPIRDVSRHVDPDADKIALGGTVIKWKKFSYIMLNKPSGYVSSTEDRGRTVMELLPEKYLKTGFFPAGRLDIDTTGLLLITNDGETAHRLLSPKYHVKKSYYFECSETVTEEMKCRLERGVDLGTWVTAPAEVTLNDGTSGTVTVTEGKFHQIKIMFHTVGSDITSLKRISFGPLELDAALEAGEWRELDRTEEAALLKAAGRDNMG